MWISYYSLQWARRTVGGSQLPLLRRRWYFSPIAKLGQPQTSLASPGVENHPSLHTHAHRYMHGQTQAHIWTYVDTDTPKNSSLPVTGGEMGQRVLWWMAFMQVICSVKREAAPHQERAAVPSSYWSIDTLSATPTSCYSARPTQHANKQHYPFITVPMSDKQAAPGILWFECHFIWILSYRWPCSNPLMATSYHHAAPAASTTLRCQRASLSQQLPSLCVSITNNIACHECHMVRCKRPPKAAFEMSMAAGSVRHICSSLGKRVIYSIPYLSNQLLRGDIASSDVINGLHCSWQRPANLFLLQFPSHVPHIFLHFLNHHILPSLLPSFPTFSSLFVLPPYITSPVSVSSHVISLLFSH